MCREKRDIFLSEMEKYQRMNPDSVSKIFVIRVKPSIVDRLKSLVKRVRRRLRPGRKFQKRPIARVVKDSKADEPTYIRLDWSDRK